MTKFLISLQLSSLFQYTKKIKTSIYRREYFHLKHLSSIIYNVLAILFACICPSLNSCHVAIVPSTVKGGYEGRGGSILFIANKVLHRTREGKMLNILVNVSCL